MVINSISEREYPIDENKRTAIIYAISDIGEYIVEIRYQHQHYMIESGSDPKRFGNLDEAKIAAQAEKAEQYFLALPKTYQETSENTSPQDKPRFDYMPC